MTTNNDPLIMRYYNEYRICSVASILAFLLSAMTATIAIYRYKQTGGLLVISVALLVFRFIFRYLKKEFGKSYDRLKAVK